MIKTLLASFILLFLSFSAHADDSEVFALRQRQRIKVLNVGLRGIMQFRVMGLERCWRQTRDAEVALLKTQIATSLAQPLSSDESQTVENINLYQATMKLEDRCQIYLNHVDHGLEMQGRLFFQPAETIAEAAASATQLFTPEKIKALARELDPHCEVYTTTDINGKQDENPCYAGDFFIARRLFENNLVLTAQEVGRFLNRIIDFSKNSSESTEIDLWALYRRDHLDSVETRLHLFEILSFLSMSTTSNAGSSDGFFEYLLRSQMRLGIKAQDIISKYHELKRLRDLWMDATRFVYKKNQRYKMRDYSFVNRGLQHDVMAAFQGCYYRKDGALLNHTLPIVLGQGYESLDFISHLLPYGLKFSVNNFKTDTLKHRTGAEWGKKFCDEAETLSSSDAD